MNQKKIIFTLALCLMLIVIPARAEIYACEQQGFTFEYDPAYTAQWEEGNGVVLYTATPEYIPYVIVYRMGKGAMPNFDVDAYFRRDIKSMQDHYGDQLLSVEEGLTLMLGELKLPGVRYVYALSGLEINGQKARIEMMVFIHETEDAVRRYTVKYDPGKGDQTISAMAQAIQSFTAKEVPVTYETFICDEEGFSIEVDSSYNVVYEENNYVRIYTETRGKVPHATVWRLATDDLSSYDIDAMHSNYAQNMRATYGERLSVAEEMSIRISGEAIKGMRYIYDNDQGYGIERAVFFQKTADVLCRYEARALEGMIDEPLAAMIHAAEHFTLHRAPEPKIIITGPSGTSQPKIIIAGPSSTPKPDIIIVNPSDVPKSPPTIVVPAPTQATSSATERRSYSRVDIVTLDGIRVGRSYVPEGYTTSTSMAYYPFDYGISMFSPVQVAFNAVAPDLNTILQYSTGQTYVHLPYGYNNGLIRYRHQDGQMFDVMQTMMLHEMDAAEYADFLAEGILSGAQLIEDISLTAEEQQLLDAIRQAMLTNPSYDGVGGVYLKDVRISIGNRIYRGHSDGDTIVVQVRTSVIAQQYDLNNNQVVRWDVPAVAICATSVENADTARKDFEMLCNNTIQSLEFKAAMQALTVNLATIITTGRRETFEIFLSDKTSGASSYDFGDVILSQDTYELSNGEYVTVPNSLPYAYADDYGNVVATNSALYEPAGMTRLYND